MYGLLIGTKIGEMCEDRSILSATKCRLKNLVLANFIRFPAVQKSLHSSENIK